MKKSIMLFFALTLFFIGVSNVKAINSEYTYDINIALAYGDYFYVDGWAVVTNKGAAIHNINPTYTLQLIGKKKDGSIIPSPIIEDDASREEYSSIGATPNDCTKPFFNKTGDIVYPDKKDSSRAKAVKDTLGNSNRFYININFSFNIPISMIDDLVEDGAVEMHMVLTAEVNKNLPSNITVYGVDFSTKNGYFAHVKKEIPVVIQKGNYADLTRDGRLDKYGITFENTVDKVEVVATWGQVRPGDDNTSTNSGYMGAGMSFYSDLYYYYDSKRGLYVEHRNPNLTPVYYHNFLYSGTANATYSVHDIGEVYLPSVYYSIRAYKTLVSNSVSNCNFGPGSGTKKCVNNGNEVEVWIPALWIKPIEGYTILKKNKDENECKGLTGKELTCCSNPDNPICLPPIDPCKDIEDPMKQYCCKYPNDKEVCDSDGGEYPKIEPENKTDTCKTNGNTFINFQYPKEGWGKQVISNRACKISCQEEMELIFRPQIGVKAGMGFTYPIDIKGSRYCAADYDNEGWQSKVNAAATAANEAFNKMKDLINRAAAKDDACGSQQVLTAPVPACPSPYTDGGRSGLTCNCLSCHSCCAEWAQTPIVPCPTKENPNAICGGGWYCASYAPCPGSTSISCPTIEGHQSSYTPDQCQVAVCSENHSILWSPAQSEITNLINQAKQQQTIYITNRDEVKRLEGERNTCDSYTTNAATKYMGAETSPKAVISTNGTVPNQQGYVQTRPINNDNPKDDADYERRRLKESKSYSIYQSACNTVYNPPSSNTNGSYRPGVISFTSTSAGNYCIYSAANVTYYDFWNKKTDISLYYEFENEYYVQDYTGAPSGSYLNVGYKYDGRKAYTDFHALSQDIPFNLNLTNLGPNLQGVTKNWSVIPFNCQYNVTNWIFPPEGDPQYLLYGGVAFMYRQVSLNNPFPNRNPGWNWGLYWNMNNNSAVIKMQQEKNKLYSRDPKYKLTITPKNMMDISIYNSNNNYSSFNQNNPYESSFLTQFKNIISGGRFQ